jgi:hypothetical protein
MLIGRVLLATQGTEGKGSDTKGLSYQLHYAASGASFGLLTLIAVELFFDTKGDNGSLSLRQTITTAMLKNPVGYWWWSWQR